MQGLESLNEFKSFVSKIGGLGRYEDTYMVHAAEGETVVPMEVLDRNPVLKKRLFKTMMEMGIEPGRYIVGNELNSKNPVTGQPEFFLKYLGKRLRKAAADISGYAAPVLGAMYGPAAGAAAGAALGQYKRENPGDPNQGMQMALRGGLSGIASNVAGGQNMFSGTGLSHAAASKTPLGMYKHYMQGEGGPLNAFKNYVKNPDVGDKKGSYKFMDKYFPGKDVTGNLSSSISDAENQINNVNKARIAAGKKVLSSNQENLIYNNMLKGGGGSRNTGFGVKDIFTKGIVPTFALAQLIKAGQPKGDDTPTPEPRKIDDMIWGVNENWADRFAADGGIMDLQDGGESKGPGTGTSDSIPAMLSDGEFVMTADAVRGAGGGDRREGAKKMYEAMDRLEARA